MRPIVFRRILIPFLLLASLVGAAAPAQAKDQHSLRILLTNDDGYSSSSTQSLRQALIAAGHQVTIVAPLTDASAVGTGLNIKFGSTLEAVERSPGIWSIAGTPGDAVAFGVRVLFASSPPDLVISGPNAGENVAALVNHSGTVGAAVTALAGGVPAVAFSTARGPSNSFPSTQQSIDFAVKVVNKLAATSSFNGKILPDHTALNVNYPVTPNGQVKFAKLGTSLPVSTNYAPAPDVCATCYRILPLPATGPDPVTDADRTLLDAGNVTITALDGSWEAGPAVTTLVKVRLTNLTP